MNTRSYKYFGRRDKRIKNWDNARDVPYQLRHGEKASFEGLIRKDPVNKDEIVVGSLNCKSNKARRTARGVYKKYYEITHRTKVAGVFQY